MVNVKILGSGCKKCENLVKKVKEIVEANSLSVEVEKITDINRMMDYKILMTPALVVNEKVVSTGIIPKETQIINWINGE